MAKSLLLAATIAAIVAVTIESFPNGSPTCDATVAELQEMSPFKRDPVNKPSTWGIAVRALKNQPQVLRVNLVGLGGDSVYSGFLLYAEDSAGKRWGSFKPASYLKEVGNKHCSDGTTITQVNSDAKNALTAFDWVVPSDLKQAKGDLTFRAAIVLTASEWYIVSRVYDGTAALKASLKPKP